jgi:hypothetical protein
MKIQFLFLCTCVLLSCAERDRSDTGISEEKTKQVLDHHWIAFQSNNLEATMQDYTDESVLITPNATYSGLEEIRENFVTAFKMFPMDSSTLNLTKSVVVKDVGYILWQAKTPTFTLTYATDSFIIRDGKIIRQTYAGLVQ